jgi:hypothetical protein
MRRRVTAQRRIVRLDSLQDANNSSHDHGEDDGTEKNENA